MSIHQERCHNIHCICIDNVSFYAKENDIIGSTIASLKAIDIDPAINNGDGNAFL